jgi:hypothetical protein
MKYEDGVLEINMCPRDASILLALDVVLRKQIDEIHESMQEDTEDDVVSRQVGTYIAAAMVASEHVETLRAAVKLSQIAQDDEIGLDSVRSSSTKPERRRRFSAKTTKV